MVVVQHCELINEFIYLFIRASLRDLISPTRDRTGVPEVEAWSPNHWTTREVP